MPSHDTESTLCHADTDRNVLVEDDLEHRIYHFLCVRGAPAAESLQFEVEEGTVRVRGRLPSEAAKRLCVECCRHVAGVVKVIDEVEVESKQQQLSNEPCSDYRKKSR